MVLDRFLDAQHPIYQGVLAELEAGQKQTHWMWFVFPQLAGLGSSSTSQRYSIVSLEEARRYLAHPLLGARLIECCHVLLGLPRDRTAAQVLGHVDAMKLQSSMTLFARADPGNHVFEQVLNRFYAGATDARTEALLPEAHRLRGPHSLG